MKLGHLIIIVIVLGHLWKQQFRAPAPIVVILPAGGGTNAAYNGDARVRFAVDLLAALGNTQPTDDTLAFVVAWQKGEGTKAAHNPLATTQPMPGDSCFNYLSGQCGVRNYPTYEVGLEATVKTVTNGRYPNIVEGLRTNNPQQALHDEELGTWGTGRGNVERNWRETQIPSGQRLASNWLALGPAGEAFAVNIRAALDASNGALRHVVILPQTVWSFNYAVGNPANLRLMAINNLGDGWCNLAALYAQAGRMAGLEPRFEDHGVGDLGAGPENSVAIWNIGGEAGSAGEAQDLELYNPTDRTVVLEAFDDGGSVSVTATIT